MKREIVALIAVLSVSSLGAKEFTVTEESPFDILKMSYETCEKNVLEKIKKEAIKQYVGCDVDVASYSIETRLISEGERSIGTDICSVEATLHVSSDFLDNNSYYLGEEGLLCAGYNLSISKEDEFYNSFELALFAGVSGSRDSVRMDSSDSSIYLKYSNIPLFGLKASYLHKIFTNQYLGANAFIAKGFETYTDSSSDVVVREDGNPAILQLGAGVFWGYRYHIKTDISLGVNYVMDSLTRNYTNETYTRDIATTVGTLQLGYFILPSMKIWGSFSSDVSASAGLSYVY